MNPILEKDFLGRFFSKPLSARVSELVRHPIKSYHKVLDRWRESANPDAPLLAREVVELLERTLTTEQSGWEWGAGGSTVWFAQRLGSLTSIEQDSDWHKQVVRRVSERGLRGVEVRHIPIEHPLDQPTGRDYDPVPKYVAAVSSVPDESLDFVLVDGHYRLACIDAACSKIRVGGLLVVDDTNWMSLAEYGVPKSFKLVLDAQDHGRKTTVWRRQPNDARVP